MDSIEDIIGCDEEDLPDPWGPWLWPNVIPSGALTVLDGDPGIGKSLLAIDLAARVTRGAAWPDGSGGDSRTNALLFCAEDSRKGTVLPRLEAAGAGIPLLAVIGTPDHPAGRVCLPADIGQMDRVFGEFGPRLVVLDPFAMFLEGGGDLRRVLMLLIGLAAEHQTAILLTRHLTKELKGRALHRGLGPVGVIGAARTGLLAAKDPADPTRCVLVSTKSNLSAPPPALAYRVADQNGQPVIEWLGRADVTADEAARGPGRSRGGQAGVVTAADWLVRALQSGERPSVDLLSAALGAGISERTLSRAKSALRVEARLVFENGRRAWLWRLPAGGGAEG